MAKINDNFGSRQRGDRVIGRYPHESREGVSTKLFLTGVWYELTQTKSLARRHDYGKKKVKRSTQSEKDIRTCIDEIPSTFLQHPHGFCS